MQPYYECISCGEVYDKAPETCTTVVPMRFCNYHDQDHLIRTKNHYCAPHLDQEAREKLCGGSISWAVETMMVNYRKGLVSLKTLANH